MLSVLKETSRNNKEACAVGPRLVFDYQGVQPISIFQWEHNKGIQFKHEQTTNVEIPCVHKAMTSSDPF